MKSQFAKRHAIILVAALLVWTQVPAHADTTPASKPPAAEPKVLYVLDGTAQTWTFIKRSDDVTLVIVSQNGAHFRALGGFGNKDLFGRIDARGAMTPCPAEVTDPATSCFEFDGSLLLGDDGSSFPAGTRAGLHLNLRLNSGKGVGDYRIAPVGELAPKVQIGTLELSKSRAEPNVSLVLALGLHWVGEHEAALAVYDRLLVRYPELAAAWGNLGWNLILQGEWAKARRVTRKAQELEPKSFAWTLNLGHTYLLQDDVKAAQDWYQKTLPLLPDENALKTGPLADFDLFIEKGWQVEASRKAQTWFAEGWQQWREAKRLVGESRSQQQAGNARQAEPLAKQALAIVENVVGPDHPMTGVRLSDLARLYQDMGQYARAEPLYVQALAIVEKSYGPEHPDTGASLDYLAGLYYDMGLYSLAEPLYVRALAIAEKSQGPEHASTGISLHNLAKLYLFIGQFARAEPLFVRSLAIIEKSLGPEDPATGAILSNLAFLYQLMGHYARAESLFVRAMAIIEKSKGPEHPDTAASLTLPARMYWLTGQYARAEPLMLRALAIAEQSQGPAHPATAVHLFNLAMLYRDMGQYARAEPYHVRALAIAEESQGPDHLHTGLFLGDLAELYRSMGQYARAEPLSVRALAIAEKSDGPEHPLTGRSLVQLALLYEAMGQSTRAEPLLLRAWRIGGTAGMPELAWMVQSNLLEFYSKTHPELAIWYGKQAVNTLQTVRAGNTGLDKDTQKSFLQKNEETYKYLADLLFAQGRLMEGQQVLAMSKEAEYFDFIQRSADSDPRQTRSADTLREKPWTERYEKISGQLATLAKEQQALAKRDESTLSAEEKSRLARLDADLTVGRQAFDRFMLDLQREFTRTATAERQQEFGKKNLDELGALQGTLGKLGHGAVTLHYLATDQRLWILLTTSTVQIMREAAISAADLGRRIGEFREAIARRDPKIRELGKDLYEVLIAPVAADLQQEGARTLMLSLDGAMRYLPMAALYDGEKFLVERYRLATYTEAAKDKLKDAPQASWSFAGFGLTRKVENFSALTAVRGELEGIATEAMTGQVKLDADFTAAAFKTSLAKAPPVVHVASHFVFKPGTEADSFLLLGDSSTLSLKQIKEGGYKFTDVDLVTLSACDTAVGGGLDENGREVEGFGALAQKQGAKGVIATLWPVADRSTGQFMRLLYGLRQTHPGMTKAEALQKAQLAFIAGRVGPALKEVRRSPTREGGNTQGEPVAGTDHPYYWAPFILMGNWL